MCCLSSAQVRTQASSLNYEQSSEHAGKSFKVMSIGAAYSVRAVALNLSIDATSATNENTNLVQQIDKLLDVIVDAARN